MARLSRTLLQRATRDARRLPDRQLDVLPGKAYSLYLAIHESHLYLRELRNVLATRTGGEDGRTSPTICAKTSCGRHGSPPASPSAPSSSRPRLPTYSATARGLRPGNNDERALCGPRFYATARPATTYHMEGVKGCATREPVVPTALARPQSTPTRRQLIGLSKRGSGYPPHVTITGYNGRAAKTTGASRH
jgi:hypothetical protein